MLALKQAKLFMCFVDLQKAFDSINRAALWAVLRHRGLSEQLISILQDLHSDTSCRVRFGSSLSSSFTTEYGTQQGDPLAGLLFNIYMDHVVREAAAAAKREAAARGIQLGVRVQFCLPESLKRLDGLRASDAGRAGSMELLQLLLADDLVAVASSPIALQLFMQQLELACQRWGLVISGSKTECMVLDPRQQLPQQWRQRSIRCQQCGNLQPEDSMLICDCCDSGWHTSCLQPPLQQVPDGDWSCPQCTEAATASGGSISRSEPVRISVAGKPVAWVQKFKYLGSQFATSGSLDAELSFRTQRAGAAFSRLHKAVWRHNSIRMEAKMRIYRVMVSTVLLYGAHCWAPTAAQLERLEVLQRQHLRSLLGKKLAWSVPPGGSQTPKRISNNELYELCQQPTIEQQLHRIRGQWVGHVLRMPDYRLAKQLFFGKILIPAPQQSRPPGKAAATLPSAYAADVSKHFTSSELRKLNSDLISAAQNKSDWNSHFSTSS